MISNSGVYGLKMQWTPEHSQWAEQHFDISSTTRSPAHKAEGYRVVPGHLQRSANPSSSSSAAAAASAYQYAWANDDISALTASNLLKKYAEKYSGLLEMPVPCGGYPPDVAAVLGGRSKATESAAEPWQDSYPMSCVPDGVSSRKGGVAAAVSELCGSPGLGGEPGYPASAPAPPAPPSQEYGPAYGAPYLHGGYGAQLPPSPLHSAGLLQPPPPPAHPSLVPGYGGSPPGLSGYSYPPAGYAPAQGGGQGRGYSPAGDTPTSYLPAGIAAPTPLPPSCPSLPGYPYHQGHGHALSSSSSSSSSSGLKRKAFYIAGHQQGELESPYGGFGGYGQGRGAAEESPMYRLTADGNNNNNNNGQKPSDHLHHHQQQQRKYSGQPLGGALTPPSYVASSLGGGSRSADSLAGFASPSLSEQGVDDHRGGNLLLAPNLSSASSSSSSSSSRAAEEQLKSSEPHLLDMVTSEILQQGPPVDWGDIAGLEPAKAALKEEVLWPMLRPDVFGGGAPRCVLLFGPRGSGRKLLGRCLASQLGAPFLQLSGVALATKWLAEGEKILRATFLVARRRQPSVVFVGEADALLSARLGDDSPARRLRGELLAQMDALLLGEDAGGGGDGGANQVLVVCSTSRPQDMDEGLRRYFGRRVLVPLPDAAARLQMVSQLLAQSLHKYCLGEDELAALARRTEGFTGLDLARLCQEALVGLLHGADVVTAAARGHVRPLTYQDFDGVFCKFQASTSQKEVDMYAEWNKMFGCSQ